MKFFYWFPFICWMVSLFSTFFGLMGLVVMVPAGILGTIFTIIVTIHMIYKALQYLKSYDQDRTIAKASPNLKSHNQERLAFIISLVISLAQLGLVGYQAYYNYYRGGFDLIGLFVIFGISLLQGGLGSHLIDEYPEHYRSEEENTITRLRDEEKLEENDKSE